MTAAELLKELAEKHGAAPSSPGAAPLDATLPAAALPAALGLLKAAGYAVLSFLSARDLQAEGKIELSYFLIAPGSGAEAVLRARLDRGAPEAPTASRVFAAADWHERETAEMFGVKFAGHPYPQRLLLPEGVTAPLRKDFRHPDMVPLPGSGK